MDYKSVLEKCIHRLAGILEVDINDKDNRQHFYAEDLVFKPMQYIESGFPFLGILKLKELTESRFPGHIRYYDCIDPKYVADTIGFLEVARDVYAADKHIREVYFPKIAGSAVGGADVDLSDVQADVALWAYETVFQMSDYKVYRVQTGEPTNLAGVRFEYFPRIVITHEAANLLSVVKDVFGKDVKPTFCLAAVLDDIEPLFSYFVLFFSYKGNVWAFTDMPVFANSFAKQVIAGRKRGVEKQRRDVYNKTLFPYAHIWQMIDNKDRKEMAVWKDRGTFFESFFSMLNPNDLLFITFVVEFVAIRLGSGEEMPQLYGAMDYINEKVLPSGDRIDSDNKYFTKQSKRSKNIYSDVVGEYADPTALVSVDYRPVLSNVNINHLGTADSIEGHLRHAAVTKVADGILEQAREDWKNSGGKDLREIQLRIEANGLEYLAEKVLRAEKILMVFTEIADGFTVKGSNLNSWVSQILDKKDRRKVNYYTTSFAHRSPYADIPLFGERESCAGCGKYAPLEVARVFIEHWKHLVFLTGGSRDELPKTYRHYMAHNFLSYTGNSLLDNVNPLADIPSMLPVNRHFNNGFNFTLCMCGYCLQRFQKKYRVSSEIAINEAGDIIASKTGDKSVIKILSGEGYKINGYWIKEL